MRPYRIKIFEVRSTAPSSSSIIRANTFCAISESNDNRSRWQNYSSSCAKFTARARLRYSVLIVSRLTSVIGANGDSVPSYLPRTRYKVSKRKWRARLRQAGFSNKIVTGGKGETSFSAGERSKLLGARSRGADTPRCARHGRSITCARPIAEGYSASTSIVPQWCAVNQHRIWIGDLALN
jgi:hypothetical protein